MFKIKSIIKQWLLVHRRKMIREMVVNDNHSVFKDDYKAPDFRRVGFSLLESATFNLTENDYRSYITTWEGYQPRLLDNTYFCISDDKYLFYLVYDHYVRTPKTLALINGGKFQPINSELSTLEQLKDYGMLHNGFVIKDRAGYNGFGVYVIKKDADVLKYKDSIVDVSELQKIISKFKNGLIQEKVSQGEYANSLYAETINTVRVITIKPVGELRHKIIGAVQRIGTDQSVPVDNFSQGGLSALVDIKTGKLGKATGIREFDENGSRLFYMKHPNLGTLIEGKQIPNWERLKESLLDVTEKLPFFELIAWDIAIQDDGFVVIETNMKSSLGLLQVHGGMRNTSFGQSYREHGFLVDDEYFRE